MHMIEYKRHMKSAVHRRRLEIMGEHMIFGWFIACESCIRRIRLIVFKDLNRRSFLDMDTDLAYCKHTSNKLYPLSCWQCRSKAWIAILSLLSSYVERKCVRKCVRLCGFYGRFGVFSIQYLSTWIGFNLLEHGEDLIRASDMNVVFETGLLTNTSAWNWS